MSVVKDLHRTELIGCVPDYSHISTEDFEEIINILHAKKWLRIFLKDIAKDVF